MQKLSISEILRWQILVCVMFCFFRPVFTPDRDSFLYFSNKINRKSLGMVSIGKKIMMGCFIEMKYICTDYENEFTNRNVWVIIGYESMTCSFNCASQAQTSVAAPQSLMIQVINYLEHVWIYSYVNLTSL